MESLVLHAFTTWHSGRLRNCELAFAREAEQQWLAFATNSGYLSESAHEQTAWWALTRPLCRKQNGGKYSELKDTGSVLRPTLVDEVCILVRGTANGGRLLRELHHLIVCLEHPASLCDSIQCPKAKKINLKKET